MTIDPLASLLVGALGAAVLTVGGGLFGAWVQARREHSRWIREQRLAAYMAYMRVTERMPSYDASDKVFNRFLDDLREANVALQLLGPTTVVEATDPYTKAVIRAKDVARYPGEVAEDDELRAKRRAASSQLIEARRALIASAQRELGIKVGRSPKVPPETD